MFRRSEAFQSCLAIADAPLAVARSKPMSGRLPDVQEDADAAINRRRARSEGGWSRQWK